MTRPARGSFDRLVTALLTHPFALAVKRPLRDAWWTVRGRALRARPLSADTASLLFVCKGNICRSPFAAVLAADLLAKAGVDGVRCTSAGFAPSAERQSPAAAIDAARRSGVALDAHRAQPLTPALVGSADAIVVTEAAHVAELARRYPEAAGRIVLLPLFGSARRGRGGYARCNIADPYGKSPEVFTACYAHIADALGDLLGPLRARAGRPPAGA
jgi:protein-tyrosine phosphatase